MTVFTFFGSFAEDVGGGGEMSGSTNCLWLGSAAWAPGANVLQAPTVLDFSPVMNQRWRCSEEPWVNESGTT